MTARAQRPRALRARARFFCARSGSFLRARKDFIGKHYKVSYSQALYDLYLHLFNFRMHLLIRIRIGMTLEYIITALFQDNFQNMVSLIRNFTIFCARARKVFCALRARNRKYCARTRALRARERMLARFARARKIFCARHPSESNFSFK